MTIVDVCLGTIRAANEDVMCSWSVIWWLTDFVGWPKHQNSRRSFRRSSNPMEWDPI